MQGVDLELFRDIPGYKAILKAVLKSQIQVLVEQLAAQTGEESVLITACIEEGTLSHLGSDIGKVFMENQDDIKSRFLGFCLKRYQIKKQTGFYTGITRKKGPTNRRKMPAPQVRQRNIHNNPIANKKTRNLNLTKYVIGVKPSQSESDYLYQNIKEEKVENTTEGNLVQIESVFIKSEQKRLTDSNYTKTKIGNKSGLSEPNTVKKVVQNDVFLTSEPVKNKQEVKLWESSDNQSYGAETCSQPLFAEIGEEDQKSSFVVLTEEGENVFEGQMGNTESKRANEVKESSSGDVHVKDEIDQEMSLYSYSDPSLKIEDSNGIDLNSDFTVLEPTSPKSEHKVKVNRRKRIKTSLDENDEDERPYPCSSCPKRFKERHHLTYHLRTHSGQRPYRCDICNKSFTQTSSLNTHRKTHLHEIYCGMCGKTFKKASSFSGHVCYATEKLD